MHRWQCGQTFDGSSASRHHDAAKRSKGLAQYVPATGWCAVGGNLSIRPRCVIGANERQSGWVSLFIGSAQPAAIVGRRERRGPRWTACWRRLPQERTADLIVAVGAHVVAVPTKAPTQMHRSGVNHGSALHRRPCAAVLDRLVVAVKEPLEVQPLLGD